ncbi:protein ripply2 [Thamnophis elegans]|uniref:protein ripply2 n=1 Tax=Thamnophis elegans TaxID=35005 RepID=UPI0013770D92|nr:protein ripply2 [Thamnophis elegans]
MSDSPLDPATCQISSQDEFVQSSPLATAATCSSSSTCDSSRPIKLLIISFWWSATLGRAKYNTPLDPGGSKTHSYHQRSEGFWRPWIPTPKDAERQLGQNVEVSLHSPSEATEDSVKLAQYTHPVRLFWPKSKCFDYMYHEAEALLRNFPVQATIFFYDESENEEDSDGTDHESGAEMDN